jgi:hypothetical protein
MFMMKPVAECSDQQIAADLFEVLAERFHDYKFVLRDTNIFVDEEPMSLRSLLLAYLEGVQMGMKYATKNGAASIVIDARRRG